MRNLFAAERVASTVAAKMCTDTSAAGYFFRTVTFIVTGGAAVVYCIASM